MRSTATSRRSTTGVTSPPRPIDGLNRSADLVGSGLSDALSPDLRAALTEWIDSARALVTAISGHVGADQFNAASERSNAARENALTRCDKAY